MKRFLYLIPLLALMGCASNRHLQDQVTDLKARLASDDQQFKELQVRYALAKAETAKGDLSQAGRDAMESVKAIWQAEGVTESYERAEKKAFDCYQKTDLSKLKTWEDYKALVFNCWHDANGK